MAKKDLMTWVLVLGAILVGALFVLPSALKAGSETWSDFWKDIWRPFTPSNGTDNATINSVTGSSGVGLKIYYEDGTSETFTPDSLQAYTIFPLLIRDPWASKTVSKLELLVSVTAAWEGTMTAWEMNLNIKETLLTHVIMDRQNFAYKGTTVLQSGVERTFVIGTVTASEIEGTLKILGNTAGTYHLMLDLYDSTFSATIDGIVYSKSGLSAETVWEFEYKTGALLSVSMLFSTRTIGV